MKIQQKIEVMQAYARGEEIEVSDKGADDWSEIKCPLWDWNSFEYRVKPIPGNFKKGDRVIFRQHEADTLMLQDIHAYGDFGYTNPFILVKVDDVLWYWEYQDVDGHWEKSDYRATRAEIEKLSNFHNFAPLYGLGFRIKDEK